MASSCKFPGDQAEIQKKLLQELESTANSEVLSLMQQGHITRNMLSSSAPVAWKYGHSDATEQDQNMQDSKFVL